MLRIARFMTCIFSALLPSQLLTSRTPSPTNHDVKSLLQRWEAEGRFHQKSAEMASICDGSTPSAGRI